MTNLNDTPSSGKLTGRDFDRRGRRQVDDALTKHGRRVTYYEDIAIEIAAWAVVILVVVAVVHVWRVVL